MCRVSRTESSRSRHSRERISLRLGRRAEDEDDELEAVLAERGGMELDVAEKGEEKEEEEEEDDDDDDRGRCFARSPSVAV